MSELIERFYPLFFAILVSALFAWKGQELLTYMAQQKWEIATIYSSVFDVSSILAAFLFAFFTFVRAADTDFIAFVRKNPIFVRFMGYLRSAIIMTALLTLITVPYMVVTPFPAERFDTDFIAVLVWVFLAVLALTMTFRSARNFMVFAMMEMPDG